VTAAVLVAFALAVALLGVLVVGLLRSHAEILRALHDLGVNLEDGAPAPRARATTTSRHAPARTAEGVPGPRDDGPLGEATDITGELPRGGSAHVAVRGVEHTTLLAFLSTGCGTCGTFWDALQDDPDAHLADPSTRIVVVTNGPEAESPAAVADLAPAGIVTVMSSAAWDDYGVPVSPYFILVDGTSGRVTGEGSGTSWEQVLDLLGKAEADVGARRRERGRPLPRMGGQDRAELVDRELRAAGIEPGDPSLYPATHPSHAAEDRP
jgi:hypothetical protein